MLQVSMLQVIRLKFLTSAVVTMIDCIINVASLLVCLSVSVHMYGANAHCYVRNVHACLHAI